MEMNAFFTCSIGLFIIGFIHETACKSKESCANYRHSRYRTIDGYCNNIHNPDWGKAETPRIRFTDTFGRPMVDSDGNAPRGYPHELPNPIQVSDLLANSYGHDTFDNLRTAEHMAWGQFVAHDLSFTDTPSGIDCCNESDPHYNNIDVCFPMWSNDFGCMNFVRSTKAPDDSNRNYREQMNLITSYIDASNVYGSDEYTAASLRVPNSYLLKTDSCNLLPTTEETSCFKTKEYTKCPIAGDVRVAEAPQLSMNHLCFLREHNYISSRLHEINPHWNHEKVFQETRRIIIAQMQHITYNFFLPLSVDPYTMQKYKLYSATSGYDDVYDYLVDPSIRNAFGVAAFRYGHSQIVPEQSELDSDFKMMHMHMLQDNFFDPSMWQENCGEGSQGLSRFLATSNACKIDSKITDGVRTKLFFRPEPPGSDLFARNINRGRDHGIPSYNEWREFCGIPKLSQFEQFGHAGHKLRSLYKSVDDIDLFVGGLLEGGVYGTVGPTFSCMIGKQFQALKEGDRYWYETSNDDIAFTEAQLDSIKRNSFLSRIWCRNFGLPKMQRNIFEVPSNRNPFVSCPDLPEVDLFLWKE